MKEKTISVDVEKTFDVKYPTAFHDKNTQQRTEGPFLNPKRGTCKKPRS